jgi:hypothetical protein
MKRQKDKKNAIEYRTSVTELHNNKMDKFEEYYKQLPQKEAELVKLKQKKKSDPTKIKELEEEIAKMKSQEEMTEYLLSIEPILRQKSLSNPTIDTSSSESASLPKRGPSQSVKDFVIESSNYEKKALLNEYYLLTAGIHYDDELSNYHKDLMCKECKCALTLDSRHSELICGECGVSNFWFDALLPQWSDTTDVTKQYRYKRPTYFKDHLNRLQAKENVVISPELLKEILLEFKKRRISSSSQVTEKLIKDILRNLNRSEYYDHIRSIKRHLIGEKPLSLTPQLETTLETMFYKTLEPFQKYKHLISGRKNYLSYPYVIHKLLDIVAKDSRDPKIKELSQSFKLLKSQEKLREQEKIWEKICNDLHWPFIRSI